jgi:hypothetical protein
MGFSGERRGLEVFSLFPTSFIGIGWLVIKCVTSLEKKSSIRCMTVSVILEVDEK